jgi:hypothetical protein
MPPFFKESKMVKAKNEPLRDALTYVPPSQQSAQGPVPKAGEPVKPEKGVLAGEQPKEMQTKYSSEDVAKQPEEKQKSKTSKPVGVEGTGSKPGWKGKL